jgi:hypothetical protein
MRLKEEDLIGGLKIQEEPEERELVNSNHKYSRIET